MNTTFDPSLYFKVGKRYHPLPDDRLFRLYREGIPCDGVWLIRNDGREAQLIGELPTPIRIDLEAYKDPLMTELVEQLDYMKTASVNDFATMLLDVLSDVIEKELYDEYA